MDRRRLGGRTRLQFGRLCSSILSPPRELAIVLVPGCQGPSLKRCSAGQDRFPAAGVDVVQGEVHQRLVAAPAPIAGGNCWMKGGMSPSASWRTALGVDNSYVARLLRLALFVPALIEAILDGTEPDGLCWKSSTARR